MMRRARAALLALLLGLQLGACSVPSGPINLPLGTDAEGRPNFAANYGLGRYVQAIAANQEPSADAAHSDMLVFVTFSGGGKRSAAFGHGALRGLGAVALRAPQGRALSLLNALDYVAGVSGGSFPAAHYALHRERSFATFPDDFLHVDVNAYIWGTYLLPWNWVWAVDPDAGTNDRMAAVYDGLMFRGATYADLVRVGRPILSINATDIVNGTTFPFLGTNFGLLCSDLNSFPIARAVAASNGFPGLFSPITLRSHAERCGGARPPLAAAPSVVPPEPDGAAARRRQLAMLHDLYADPARTRYVHLMDGGIADNLALRGLLGFFIVLQAEDELFRRTALDTRRVLVVSVDGEAEAPRTLGLERRVGGVLQVLSAASGTQIDAYNFETLGLAREQVAHLVERIRATRCAAAPVVTGRPCDDVRGEFVHLSLSDIQDPEWRARLGAIPTGLTIPRPDVAALVEFGETLVRDHPVIRAIAAEADILPPGGPVLGRAGPARRRAASGAARSGSARPGR